MHVQDLRAFSNLHFIKEKIDACQAFAAEFHLDEKHSGMEQGMSLPKGVVLKDLMPEKKYNKLRKVILKSTDLDIAFFPTTLPFMLTGLIGSQLLGKEMPEPLDQYLWDYAKACGKSLLGIETLAEQLAILEKIPLGLQLKMLLGLGRNVKQFRQRTFHSAKLYQQGELQRLSKSVIKNAGKLRKVMIYRRNEVMADRVFELVQQNSLFAAIGAGHLGGGKGVIRLLKKRGVRMLPVK